MSSQVNANQGFLDKYFSLSAKDTTIKLRSLHVLPPLWLWLTSFFLTHPS